MKMIIGTGMDIAIAEGTNMAQPLEKKELVVRAKTAMGYTTLSLADEQAGTMLLIRVNDDVKELLRKFLKEE